MHPAPTADTSGPADAGNAPGVPLSLLGCGERAIVHCRLLAAADNELLCAMGMPDRCVLRVCRAGEPCIVQVAATRLALSRSVASRVMVIPAVKDHGAPGHEAPRARRKRGRRRGP
jgi:Fe2+ transport system protein FeoA